MNKLTVTKTNRFVIETGNGSFDLNLTVDQKIEMEQLFLSEEGCKYTHITKISFKDNKFNINLEPRIIDIE